ncbi:MAG: hypothetical protein ACE37H_04865 [Phycisphaeraceae bacterium]
MRFETKQLVTREINTKAERLDDLEQHLGMRASDTERIKQLVRDLKDGGTSEVRQTLEASVSEARDTVRSKFESEYDETQREQAEAKALQQEVQDEASRDTANAAEINKAHADLNTEEAREPLDQAAAELKDEAEILDAEAKRLEQRHEASLRTAEQLVRQVREGIA